MRVHIDTPLVEEGLESVIEINMTTCNYMPVSSAWCWKVHSMYGRRRRAIIDQNTLSTPFLPLPVSHSNYPALPSTGSNNMRLHRCLIFASCASSCSCSCSSARPWTSHTATPAADPVCVLHASTPHTRPLPPRPILPTSTYRIVPPLCHRSVSEMFTM